MGNPLYKCKLCGRIVYDNDFAEHYASHNPMGFNMTNEEAKGCMAFINFEQDKECEELYDLCASPS